MVGFNGKHGVCYHRVTQKSRKIGLVQASVLWSAAAQLPLLRFSALPATSKAGAWLPHSRAVGVHLYFALSTLYLVSHEFKNGQFRSYACLRQ